MEDLIPVSYMKPLILLSVLCTSLTAASLTTTNTSNWSGNQVFGPGSVVPISGTGSTNLGSGFSIFIQSNESAQYGNISVSVNANSGMGNPGYTGTTPFNQGPYPRYQLSHVEASGSASFADKITLFTSGIGSGTIAFSLAFPGYGSPDMASASGSFTAGSQTANSGVIFQTLTIPFTLGQAIPISAFVSGTALDSVPNDSNFGASSIGPVVAVQSIQVFGPGGTQLSGYGYGTESAASYPFVGGTAVPEPGSFALIALALTLLALFRSANLRGSSLRAPAMDRNAATRFRALTPTAR
jgi:hypothetical protein